MATLTSAAAAEIANWVFNGTSTTAGQRWLALCTSLTTEVTHGSYGRYDLAAAMPTFTSGYDVSSSVISANVGTQTATHYWITTTSNSSTSTTILTGLLNTPQTGAFTITSGAITGTVQGL